ncbi:hypothetical protein KCU88_g888, partial [Aureobasidium melanogenum]
MAKAKATSPKHDEKPCSEKGVRTMAPEPPKVSPFLLLPAEIRLQIYSYFILPLPKCPDEVITCAEGDENTDRQGDCGFADVENDANMTAGGVLEPQILAKTRRNLTLVCREIAKEWAPLFFRSTTIVVDPTKEDLWHFSILEGARRPCHGRGLREFDANFLRTLDVSRLHNIRRLMCNAYIWCLDYGGEAASRNPSDTLAHTRGLGEILDRYRDAMPSLAEVVVSDDRPGYVASLDELDISQPENQSGVNDNDARSIWTAIQDQSTWDEIIEELQSGKCALLRGWKVNKHVSLIRQNYLYGLYGPDIPAEVDEQDFLFVVHEVQITFRKIGDKNSEHLESTELVTVSYAVDDAN